MQKNFVVRTRWEYYVANISGILFILALFIWFVVLAINDEGIDFKSIFFWLALLLLIAIPYGLISFFSSMKGVEVKGTGLIISYVFQKHKNVIQFSEIATMMSQITDGKNIAQSRFTRDTFKIILVDGRVFEFSQSQFDQYGKLKAICWRKVGK